MKRNLLAILFFVISCNNTDPNYLGNVERLPKGEYRIYNYGSRHTVRCVQKDGKYFYLNDHNFSKNGIPGHDANEYYEKDFVYITVK